MQPGFFKPTLDTRSEDGRNSVSLEPMYYLDDDGTITCCPEGSWSDGISTPAILWATDPPFGPGRWKEGRWHDGSVKYRCTMVQWYGDHWGVPNMTFEQCNATLRRMLIRGGMTELKADAYFEALELAGMPASIGDLAEAVGHIVTPPNPPWL